MEETGLETRLGSGRDVTDPGLEATEQGLIDIIQYSCTIIFKTGYIILLSLFLN